MFKFLKRSAPVVKPVAVRRATSPAAPAHHDFAPAPLPEVIEGDGEADWSLWQDSVLSSQLQPLTGFGETDSGDLSAFDSVGKRGQ